MKIRIIKEARGRRKAAAQQPKATTTPLGYSETNEFHLFAVDLSDPMVNMVDAEATKTEATEVAKEALKAKGIDMSSGFRILRTGFSDGVFVVGVPKRMNEAMGRKKRAPQKSPQEEFEEIVSKYIALVPEKAWGIGTSMNASIAAQQAFDQASDNGYVNADETPFRRETYTIPSHRNESGQEYLVILNKI